MLQVSKFTLRFNIGIFRTITLLPLGRGVDQGGCPKQLRNCLLVTKSVSLPHLFCEVVIFPRDFLFLRRIFMSKFFYEGKANNNNERGSNSIAGNKAVRIGTKKVPAKIIVQTEERKQDVVAILDKNKWFADIIVDAEQEENIKDLEFLQNKNVKTVTKPLAGRNDPCPCGSGKKFKKCCGA